MCACTLGPGHWCLISVLCGRNSGHLLYLFPYVRKHFSFFHKSQASQEGSGDANRRVRSESRPGVLTRAKGAGWCLRGECFMCTHTHPCTHAHTCTYMHVPVHTYIHVHTETRTRACIYMRVHTFMHTYLGHTYYSCCSSSLIAKACLTVCDPMDCSTSGFPVLHCLPEFAQACVH